MSQFRFMNFRNVLAGASAAALLGAALIPAGAHADTVTKSVSLTVQGTVAAQCALTLSGTGASGAALSGGTATLSTDLSSGNSTITATLGTINETCNKGYSVSLSDINNGSLSNGTDTISYTVSYGGGSAFAPTTAGTTITPSRAKTGKDGISNLLAVNVTPAFVSPGTYSDALTITLTAP